MNPTNEELEKVFNLFRKYTKLKVYDQQRIDMFNYIKKHWND